YKRVPAMGRPFSRKLLRAIGDEAASGIVWRHRNRHLITEHDTNSVAAHAPGEVRQDRMPALNIDAEVPADQDFHDFPFHLDQIVSRHPCTFRKIARSPKRGTR